MVCARPDRLGAAVIRSTRGRLIIRSRGRGRPTPQPHMGGPSRSAYAVSVAPRRFLSAGVGRKLRGDRHEKRRPGGAAGATRCAAALPTRFQLDSLDTIVMQQKPKGMAWNAVNQGYGRRWRPGSLLVGLRETVDRELRAESARRHWGSRGPIPSNVCGRSTSPLGVPLAFRAADCSGAGVAA
jgi:hypothetical protein